MPIFFFDIGNGERQNLDEDGQEMVSPEPARVEVIRALQELFVHVVPKAGGVEYTRGGAGVRLRIGAIGQ